LKISIITAVLNSKTFLESSLLSVSSQTYPDIEHIIIDGGSIDGSLEVISRFTSNTSRFTPHDSRLISEPDNGIYDALNKGIRLATGDIIGFLHADDIYADDSVIEKVVRVMRQKNCDSCYGNLLYVNRNDPNKTIRYWKSSDFSPGLLRKGWMPPHPTFFVRREVYEKFGIFDSSFKIAADYELILRLLGKYKITSCYIPEVLIKMRMGGASNRSISNILLKSTEDLRAIKMHDIGGLPTLLRKNLSKISQFFRNREE
jgi:glycosyltransferase